MKFTDILSSLSKANAANPASRREVISRTAATAGKAFLATLPAGLGALAFPAKAAASTPDALNLMLEAKLLLKALYGQGASATFSSAGHQGVISASDTKKAINEVLLQVDAQVTVLTSEVTNAGATPVTVQAQFPADTLTDRRLFMAIAQVLHDVSSKAIKGLLPALESSSDHLMKGIGIQAADSRYATLWQIARNSVSPQFFPAEASDYTSLPQELIDFGAAAGVDIAQTVYQGENNTQQLGTDLAAIVPADPLFVAGAFDEPLLETEARKVLNLFAA